MNVRRLLLPLLGAALIIGSGMTPASAATVTATDPGIQFTVPLALGGIPAGAESCNLSASIQYSDNSDNSVHWLATGRVTCEALPVSQMQVRVRICHVNPGGTCSEWLYSANEQNAKSATRVWDWLACYTCRGPMQAYAAEVEAFLDFAPFTVLNAAPCAWGGSQVHCPPHRGPALNPV
ncbi:MAG: hypothetical protein QOE45_3135 [Frankiaceae bacterium]|jgi:hypothetical protein|nr:hypothetical protein [Frankiaceae bacterium]